MPSQYSDAHLIVSYPKSGRTWLRFALTEAGIPARFTHAGAATNRKNLGRPFDTIPDDLAHRPLVFLHRDPIDTAVSMFYQVHHRDFRRGSHRWWRGWLPLALRGRLPPTDIDAFVRHPGYGVPKIAAYNRAWLDHLARRGDGLVLRYEDMRRDPAAQFQRLLDYWNLSDVSGARLAELSSFDRMRAVEISATGNAALRPRNAADPASFKTRKGKVGGYRDELQPDTIRACQAEVARHDLPQALPSDPAAA